MKILPVAALAFVFTCLLALSNASAQEPGYSLELYSDLLGVDPGAPGDPFAVRAGSEIRYRIEARVPSPVPDVAYYFEIPPGTDFISAERSEGVDVTVEEPPGGTIVVAEPNATFSRVEIDVRVNDTYQGPVTGIARFRGSGPGDPGAGSSAPSRYEFDHGEGVPGQLTADSFIDMNGNALFEQDDVRERCSLYVYENLAGVTIPTNIASPTDSRLPLASMGEVTMEEPATMPLFAGTYSVLFGGCDTPLPPSGLPVTTTEPINQPAVIVVSDQSRAMSFEVQTVDVEANLIASVLRAAQPIGPTATPISIQFDGSTLRWVDQADGEDGYRVVVTGTAEGVFDLPPNASTFQLPPDLIEPCGMASSLNFAVTAQSRGAGGFPGTTSALLVSECPSVLPPNTGTGSEEAHASSRFGTWIVGVGTVLVLVGCASRFFAARSQ